MVPQKCDTITSLHTHDAKAFIDKLGVIERPAAECTSKKPSLLGQLNDAKVEAAQKNIGKDAVNNGKKRDALERG